MRSMIRRYKKYLFLLGCIAFAAFLVPFTVVAEGEEQSTKVYHEEDVKAVRKIIESSQTLQDKYRIDDGFSDWNSIEEVVWEGETSVSDGDDVEYRVTQLYLNSIEDLSELDVSALEKLEVLHCDNTQITILDLSRNTALTELKCNNTYIATLDLTKNTDLKVLECANTQVTNLDLSYNTALTQLYCNTIESPNGEFSLKDLKDLTDFRVGFVGSDVKFVSCSGYTVSLSIPAGVVAEIIYTCKTDENGYAITDGDGKVLETLMWYVLGAPEDLACLRYSGLSEEIRFENGKGTSVSINNNLDIKARIVTEEELQPGIGIEGASMNPAYRSDTFNYTATVGYDVSKVTLTGGIASLPDAEFEGLGEKELNVGDNTFRVTLRIPLFEGASDYGLERTYTIVVTREGKADSAQGGTEEPTPEPTPEPTTESTPEPTPEPTTESTPEPTKITKSPDTGDNSNIEWYLLAMLLAGAGLIVVTVKKKHNN